MRAVARSLTQREQRSRSWGARGGGTDLLEPQLVGVVTPSGNVRYWAGVGSITANSDA